MDVAVLRRSALTNFWTHVTNDATNLLRSHPSRKSALQYLRVSFVVDLQNVLLRRYNTLEKNLISYGNYVGYIYFSRSPDLPTGVGGANSCWQCHRVLAIPSGVGNDSLPLHDSLLTMG